MDYQNLIIGAGPAGLAVAGRLKKRGIDFHMVEASHQIANSWHNHYDRLHLHTVKQWSHLPHKEFPKDYPLYVSRKELVEYLTNYAKEFSINPEFNKKAHSIKKDNKLWNVEFENGSSYSCKNVIIATGVNREPNIPQWKGQDTFTGQIIHSKEYKNATPYKGQSILVVGMGNTGAEIALDLSENDVQTYLSVRGPVNIVPRDLNGRPVQVTAKQLAKLPFGIGTSLGSMIRKMYIGNLAKFGVETPDMSPTRQLLETGKTPVVDIGTVKAIKEGNIVVYKNLSHFEEHKVVFEDGKKVKVNNVILATGYKPNIQNFIEHGDQLLDKYGCPNPAIAPESHKGMYFVGFDNYKLGGILGIIMEESKTIADHIEGQS